MFHFWRDSSDSDIRTLCMKGLHHSLRTDRLSTSYWGAFLDDVMTTEDDRFQVIRRLSIDVNDCNLLLDHAKMSLYLLRFLLERIPEKPKHVLGGYKPCDVIASLASMLQRTMCYKTTENNTNLTSSICLQIVRYVDTHQIKIHELLIARLEKSLELLFQVQKKPGTS